MCKNNKPILYFVYGYQNQCGRTIEDFNINISRSTFGSKYIDIIHDDTRNLCICRRNSLKRVQNRITLNFEKILILMNLTPPHLQETEI